MSRGKPAQQSRQRAIRHSASHHIPLMPAALIAASRPITVKLGCQMVPHCASSSLCRNTPLRECTVFFRSRSSGLPPWGQVARDGTRISYSTGWCEVCEVYSKSRTEFPSFFCRPADERVSSRQLHFQRNALSLTAPLRMDTPLKTHF